MRIRVACTIFAMFRGKYRNGRSEKAGAWLLSRILRRNRAHDHEKILSIGIMHYSKVSWLCKIDGMSAARRLGELFPVTALPMAHGLGLGTASPKSAPLGIEKN